MGFGTYGLPGHSLGDAVKRVAAAGFTSVEIVSIPGCHGDPDTLTKPQRREIRGLIEGLGLQMGALMGLPFPEQNRLEANRDRLKRLLELAGDLATGAPPLIQSVLGGGLWEEKKNLFRDVLGDWVALAGRAGVRLSIKPHRGHAMSRPEDAVWLIRQLNAGDRLSLVYDYSHYAFRGMSVEETVDVALPHTGYLVMKDAIQYGGKVRFALPGESAGFPHEQVLRRFYEGGYRGEVCCEVSSQVWRASGYDPQSAIKTCQVNMSGIFAAAGVVPRRRAR
jgi:sugar phosphate isomerase/epimerase